MRCVINLYSNMVFFQVSRFAQLRIIVLTIFKAFKVITDLKESKASFVKTQQSLQVKVYCVFQSMAFIMILLMLFMYIFAVAGTIVFDSYSKSKRTDLKYKNSFRYLQYHFFLFVSVDFFSIFCKTWYNTLILS